MADLWVTFSVIQHHYPLDSKVTLKVEELTDAEGTYEYSDEEGHVIRISTAVEADERAEVLCHEYAHACVNGYYGPESNAVWGVCYSGLYRLIFGDH